MVNCNRWCRWCCYVECRRANRVLEGCFAGDSYVGLVKYGAEHNYDDTKVEGLWDPEYGYARCVVYLQDM